MRRAGGAGPAAAALQERVRSLEAECQRLEDENTVLKVENAVAVEMLFDADRQHPEEAEEEDRAPAVRSPNKRAEAAADAGTGGEQKEKLR